MLLEQLDFEYRIPMPASPGNYYYWTHTWIYDLDNPPPTNTSLYWLSVYATYGTLANVQLNRYQKTQPPYSGVPYFKTNTPRAAGLLVTGESWSLFNTVRMNFYAGGKYVGYKRWRVPLRDIDIVDGKLSPFMYGLFRDTIAPGLLFCRICSRTGEPIDHIEVSPAVHQWQWRHGSKRRTRHVIDIP